jgi:hypothetical protein
VSTSEPSRPSAPPGARGIIDPAYLAAVGVLVAAAAGLSAYITFAGVHLTKLPIYPEENRKLHQLPERAPARNPNWVQDGADQLMSKEEQDELGTDNFVTRWYVEQPPRDAPDDWEPRVFQLHMTYYTGLLDTVPHVPERCFTGAGMSIAGDRQIVPVPLDFSRLVPDPQLSPPDVDVMEARESKPDEVVWTARGVEVQNRFRLPENVEDLKLNVTPFTADSGQQIYAGYFFIANGAVVPTADEVRLQSFTLTADYSYYLKVQFLAWDVESAEELAELAGAFLDDMFAEIMRCVPDWYDVERGLYPPESASASARPSAS